MGNNISAIILAAGESRRMGTPKLLLPWGDTTVLGKVVETFAAGLLTDSSTDLETDKRTCAQKNTKTAYEIVVVTGSAHEKVEEMVARLAQEYPIRAVYNPDYAGGGMLSSIQTGLASLNSQSRATLIGLGDQPQVREETVRRICAAFVQTRSLLVIPSFQNRRGHPWLASRRLWPEILALPTTTVPHQFINDHADQIEYVSSDESVLQDLDTPEDYARQRP